MNLISNMLYNITGGKPMIEIGIISFIIGMFGTYTILDLANRKKMSRNIKYNYEVPMARPL